MEILGITIGILGLGWGVYTYFWPKHPPQIQNTTKSGQANTQDSATSVTVEGTSSESALIEKLRQELLESYPGDRSKAARKLGQIGAPAAATVPTLILKLKDSSGPVRDAAAWALREIGTEAALSALARYENDT